MALTRMTIDQIAAPRAGRVNRAVVDATTEADIRHQMLQDGEDPDAEPRLQRVVRAADVRRKLGLTQDGFSRLLDIPVATLRNWEQERFVMDPAARTLFKIIDREPEAALRALGKPEAA